MNARNNYAMHVVGVQTLRPTLLFSGFRHFVPYSGRGEAAVVVAGGLKIHTSHHKYNS